MVPFTLTLLLLAVSSSAANIHRLREYNRLADPLPDDYEPSPEDVERTQELLDHIQNFKQELAKQWLSAPPSSMNEHRLVPSDVGEFIDDGEGSDIYIPPESFPVGFDYPDYNTDAYLAPPMSEDIDNLEAYYPSLFYQYNKKRSDSGTPHYKSTSEGGFQRLYDTIKQENLGTIPRKHGKVAAQPVEITTTTTRKPKMAASKKTRKPKMATTTTTASPRFLSPQRRGQFEVPNLRPAVANDEKDNLERELPSPRITRSSQHSSKHHSKRVVSTEAELTQELKKLKQQQFSS